MSKQFKSAEEGVKQARNRLLWLHKILMDWDRARYEAQHGPQTAGKFLEMLLSEPRFEWLRVLSTLIVRIDEAFDLDDGVSMEMLEGFRQEIRDIFDEESGEYGNFQARFREARPLLNDTGRLTEEILAHIDWQ
ncbi:MAG: hypothetical protein IPM63_03010 [Acidobacteriota bacterium]|nr:MAG: hypothetical protein IPM63_03010 [Acidobacteriota bacterium]